MPAPLAPGHIHLAFHSHPPPSWHYPLSLFRPAHFPLGVVGIADASSASSVSAVLAEFNALVRTLLPHDSMFPLATNLFAFEEVDGTASMEIGGTLPGAVVIPSVMGNKSIYIGTLLAELCSRILTGFADLVCRSHILNINRLIDPRHVLSKSKLAWNPSTRPFSLHFPKVLVLPVLQSTLTVTSRFPCLRLIHLDLHPHLEPSHTLPHLCL